jgi:hypothetical protein
MDCEKKKKWAISAHGEKSWREDKCPSHEKMNQKNNQNNVKRDQNAGG